MGSVTTACSHDPNRDCVANDLSFTGWGRQTCFLFFFSSWNSKQLSLNGCLLKHPFQCKALESSNWNIVNGCFRFFHFFMFSLSIGGAWCCCSFDVPRCVPSRSCNRCLDPDPRPPGYVRSQVWMRRGSP